jgi:hypothetical protein
MAKIIWLASYPKSGNTWMRILLANYLRDTSEPADINNLTVGSIASARIWFDEWVGVEASAFEDAIIERLRPYVYRCMAEEVNETFYMKVHDAWGLTDLGEGLFPADVTGGVIYILRNPLDVAISCAHHWGITLKQAVHNLCDPGYILARSLGGMADQLPQYLGSWSRHVTSWLNDSGLPVHLVRYEDLQLDPVSAFSDVVRFCGLTLDTVQINKAVTFSDFTELQRQESENNFRERSLKAPGQFFRRGQVGAWRDELPSELMQRLIDVHGESMRRFGYLDGNFQPI